jgi:Asp-tRNA(Asn)/Glu-tRNA(Gln) amidotransferase A subunit family amidase
MPTLTPATKQKYRSRAKQVAEAANAAARRDLSPTELSEAVVKRRVELAGSSFRQLRAALIFTMTEVAEMQPELARQLQNAIRVLKNAPCHPVTKDEVLRTSQQKQKELDDDLERICHAALATTSPHAQHLEDLLVTGSLTGARLIEWPTAAFTARALVAKLSPNIEWFSRNCRSAKNLKNYRAG